MEDLEEEEKDSRDIYEMTFAKRKLSSKSKTSSGILTRPMYSYSDAQKGLLNRCI